MYITILKFYENFAYTQAVRFSVLSRGFLTYKPPILHCNCTFNMEVKGFVVQLALKSASSFVINSVKDQF
jgi:hypothetical protein